MRQTKTFEMFGMHYKTTQFAACEAFAMMGRLRDLHPCEILANTSIIIASGDRRLADADAIDHLVKDSMGHIPPRIVLNALMAIVSEYNFDFLGGWKPVRVPPRFMSDAKSVESSNADPIVAQLVQENVATLKELEEYYSLKDAFQMFDILMAKGVNAALSHEAATKKAARR
jgi:hypothetical protein